MSEASDSSPTSLNSSHDPSLSNQTEFILIIRLISIPPLCTFILNRLLTFSNSLLRELSRSSLQIKPHRESTHHA